MSDKKITPSDLRSQAQDLISAGKMPSLEDVLDAVATARTKYAPQIREAREPNHKQSTGLRDLSGKKD